MRKHRKLVIITFIMSLLMLLIFIMNKEEQEPGVIDMSIEDTSNVLENDELYILNNDLSENLNVLYSSIRRGLRSNGGPYDDSVYGRDYEIEVLEVVNIIKNYDFNEYNN